MKLICTLLSILTLSSSINAVNSESPFKRRTLVLLDNLFLLTTHSKFFNDMRAKGHKLTIKLAKEEEISSKRVKLHKDKVYLYDNLVLMCLSLTELPEIPTFNIKQFFDDGNNVFFVADYDTSPYFRKMVLQFGFKFHEKGSYLIDYSKAINHISPHVFMAAQFRDFDYLSEGVDGDIVYNGIGLGMTHFENDQLTVFARGNLHTASILYDDQGRKKYLSMGRQNILNLGIQGLNNARCLVSGSLDMFSNESYDLSKGNNGIYAQNLVEWLSQVRGVVVKTAHSHSCIDKKGRDSDCPVRCDFRFSVDLITWNWNRNIWEPYTTDDIFIEVTMMTPKFRKYLTEDSANPGHYSIIGNMPDRMGTYRFKLHYQRPGWSFIDVYDKVFSRPWHHKEYTKNWMRDLPSAVGFITVLAAFALMSFIFLYDNRRLNIQQKTEIKN